jgi:hypothetical protein
MNSLESGPPPATAVPDRLVDGAVIPPHVRRNGRKHLHII